jgi:hypothetical protein
MSQATLGDGDVEKQEPGPDDHFRSHGGTPRPSHEEKEAQTVQPMVVLTVLPIPQGRESSKNGNATINWATHSPGGRNGASSR